MLLRTSFSLSRRVARNTTLHCSILRGLCKRSSVVSQPWLCASWLGTWASKSKSKHWPTNQLSRKNRFKWAKITQQQRHPRKLIIDQHCIQEMRPHSWEVALVDQNTQQMITIPWRLALCLTNFCRMKASTAKFSLNSAVTQLCWQRLLVTDLNKYCLRPLWATI